MVRVSCVVVIHNLMVDKILCMCSCYHGGEGFTPSGIAQQVEQTIVNRKVCAFEPHSRSMVFKYEPQPDDPPGAWVKKGVPILVEAEIGLETVWDDDPLDYRIVRFTDCDGKAHDIPISPERIHVAEES